MLKMGASKPWQDAMEALTGQREVLATPLLNYFEPLRVWLEQKNAETGEYIGWDIPPPAAAASAAYFSSTGSKNNKAIKCPSVNLQGLNGMKGARP